VLLEVERGTPAPAFLLVLSCFDGYRSERLPANLLHEQRDYCGAHTCKRLDIKRGEFFRNE